MGISCLRRPPRVRFCAIFSWICLRAHSLSNIFVWLRTLLQSCSWSNDRIKNNEEEEGHVLIHWLLHGERTLGNYLFRQKCIEHVERAFFFPVRRWLKRRGGRGTWRRRRRRRQNKRRKNDSAGRRRWFCRRFLAAGKQHIISYVAGACLGVSLVMRVFAYALPTFRLRGAYAGELLYFRILAMQTSRLETLQKRERNSSH